MNNLTRRMLLGVVVAGASLVSTTHAVQAAEVTAGVDLASAYVWRGVTFNDDAVLQPYVDVAHDSGLSFNVWGNMDLGSFGGTLEEGEFSEVDLTVAYAIPLPDDAEMFSASVGLITYLFPQLGADTTTHEVYLSLGLAPVDAVSFSGDVYYDFDEVNDFYFALGASLDLLALVEDSPEGLGLGISTGIGFAGDEFAAAYAGTDSGAFDWNIGISASYAVTESVEATAFLNYTDSADKDVLPDQQVDIYGGVGVSYSF